MTADAGSRSHSPVPIPVASAIDTAMKVDLSNSTSESDNLLSLKQGIAFLKKSGLSANFYDFRPISLSCMQHFDNWIHKLYKKILCDFIGDEPEVYVTTPLSPDGSFWVQLAAAE